MTSENDPTVEVTPADLRTLAGQAETLAQQTRAACIGLRNQSDTKQATFRMDDLAGQLEQAAEELRATASDVARARTARDDRLCGLPSGACPDHGATLASSGGRSWCTQPGCGRQWDYDRLGTPCQEPVSHQITDPTGTTFTACAAHAADAKRNLTGATITPTIDT